MASIFIKRSALIAFALALGVSGVSASKTSTKPLTPSVVSDDDYVQNLYNDVVGKALDSMKEHAPKGLSDSDFAYTKERMEYEKKQEDLDKEIEDMQEKFQEDAKPYLEDKNNAAGVVLFNIYMGNAATALSKAMEEMKDKKKTVTYDTDLTRTTTYNWTNEDVRGLKLEFDDDAVDEVCIAAKFFAKKQVKQETISLDKTTLLSDFLKEGELHSENASESCSCSDDEKKEVLKQLQGFGKYLQQVAVTATEKSSDRKAAEKKLYGGKTEEEILAEYQRKNDPAGYYKLMLEKFDQMKKIKLAFAQWNLAESKTEFENQKRFVEKYKKIDFKKFSESDLDKAFAAQNKVVSANLPTRDIFWAKNGMKIIMIIVAVIAGIFLAVLLINCMCGNCKSSKRSENDVVDEDGEGDETSRLEHGEYKQFGYDSV